MNREERMYELRQIIDGLNNSSTECLAAISEYRCMELENAVLELHHMCFELRYMLSEINDCDEAATGDNCSNSRHLRQDIQKLLKDSKRILECYQ